VVTSIHAVFTASAYGYQHPAHQNEGYPVCATISGCSHGAVWASTPWNVLLTLWACTSLNGFAIIWNPLCCISGRLSAHSYNTLLTGKLFVAVGGRASSPRWGRKQTARLLKWSNRCGITLTASERYCTRSCEERKKDRHTKKRWMALQRLTILS